MRTIGFPISRKPFEKRRAITPDDIKKYVKSANNIYIESGYGKVLGIEDCDYEKLGCNVVSREKVLMQDIICDPKIGDAEYLGNLNDQILFGWIHAVQNKDICDKIVNGSNTAYAFEDMYENGVHSFYRNNQLAGEAACLHAFLNHGFLPLNKKIAILGNGNTSKGAQNILIPLKAKVKIYDRYDEKKFIEEMDQYDVIVNCVLWDVTRKDHIINYDDFARLKKDCLIIDISCDHNGAIEGSHPTMLDNPTYKINGVTIYGLDHTPTLLFKEATQSISMVVARFLDELLEEKEGEVLSNAKIINHGIIIDNRIKKYQNRK